AVAGGQRHVLGEEVAPLQLPYVRAVQDQRVRACAWRVRVCRARLEQQHRLRQLRGAGVEIHYGRVRQEHLVVLHAEHAPLELQDPVRAIQPARGRPEQPTSAARDDVAFELEQLLPPGV